MVRASWADSYPRTAIVWWYLVGLAGFVATVTATWAVTVSPLPGSLWSRSVLFVGTLMSGHPLAGLGLNEAVGLTLTTDLVALVVGGAIVNGCVTFRRRQRHRELVDLVARRDFERDAYVVDHDEFVAYYVPGRNGRVVVSSAVSDTMDSDIANAVMAHERGHRSGRHERWLSPLMAVQPFFMFVPYAHLALSEVRALVEMAADDFAIADVGRQSFAKALSAAPLFAVAPRGAVAWDDSVLARRQSRLALPMASLRRVVAAHTPLPLACLAIMAAWLAH
jgi:Zn-dependent protease with chaperone function